MKEFIDKLIERLEEKAGTAEQEMNYYRELSEEDASCEVFADSHGKEYEAYCGAIDIVNELAEEYKVSEMPTGWIPVSERLPEYTDEYNVTVDVASEFGCYRTVKTLRFERIEGKEPKWVIPQDEVYRVIAWCELPAPYTEGE